MKKSRAADVKWTIDTLFARIEWGDENARHELEGMMSILIALGEMDLYNSMAIYWNRKFANQTTLQA